jgi:hypothetical protein
MTQYEYNALDELEQTEALWEYAVHVGEYNNATFRYVLYSMFSFYVELKYNMKRNAINGSRSFSDLSQLEPYLPFIDISEIKL